MIDLQCVLYNLCGSDNVRILFIDRDYRFVLKGEYEFVKCNICNHIYLNPRPTKEAISELYGTFYSSDNRSRTSSSLAVSPIAKYMKRI